MNIQNPVSQIMTKNLITIHPSDKLSKVEELFSTNKIHHIPVAECKTLVGLISKSDLNLFKRGLANLSASEKAEELNRYNMVEVKEIMTTGIASISSSDKIAVAIEIFKENLFHCIPIVDNEELTGIVTPLDIIKNI